jgi:hypothetical protein
VIWWVAGTNVKVLKVPASEFDDKTTIKNNTRKNDPCTVPLFVPGERGLPCRSIIERALDAVK